MNPHPGHRSIAPQYEEGPVYDDPEPEERTT